MNMLIMWHVHHLTTEIDVTCKRWLKLKEAWNSLFVPLWQGNLYKVAAPYFFYIFIVQLFQEACMLLQICWVLFSVKIFRFYLHSKQVFVFHVTETGHN